MKVIEHLERAAQAPVSFEIIPPRRGGSLQALWGLIGELSAFSPPFIDITSHPAEVVARDTPSGRVERLVRKRPGTLGLCALVQHKFGIDAVPHVLCQSFSREETEDFLIELRYLGIDNVLALRGDDRGYEKALGAGRSANAHAVDLVEQITAMNRGVYLDGAPEVEASDFCIGVAGYPEKHMDAPDMAQDIAWARRKVDAGASYLVTQMFFDNHRYLSFVGQCRAAGIGVPIIPGLKVLTSKTHLRRLPEIFACALPAVLRDGVESAATPKDVRAVGIEWAAQQAEALLNQGAPAVHFYVMQSAAAVKEVLWRLKI